MMVLLPIISLLGFCFFLKRFTSIAIEATPLYAISFLVLLLYMFAYLDILPLGVALLLIAGVVSFLCAAKYFQTHVGLFYQVYLTPNMIIWIGVCIVFCLIASTYNFQMFDEFMHWGPHAKTMFARGGFEGADDFVIHKTYPPGPHLFYYFFYSVTGFSEGLTEALHTLLLLSPVPVFLSQLQKVKLRSRVFAWGTFFVLVYCVSTQTVTNLTHIYMDVPTSYMLGAILILYYFSRRDGAAILWLIPPVMTVVLMRPKVMGFVCLVIALISVVQLIRVFYEKAFLTKRNAYIAGSLILLFVCALGVDFSWQHYLATINVAPEWELNVDVSTMISALGPNKTVHQAQIITSFMRETLTHLPKLFMLMAAVVVLFKKMRDPLSRRVWLGSNLVLFIVFFAYLFGLLLLYLFAFDRYEAEVVNCLWRYIGLYYVPWFCLIFAAYHKHTKLFESAFWLLIRNAVLTFASCFLILNVATTIDFYADLTSRKATPFDLRLMLDRITSQVKQKTPAHSKVFIVWQNSHQTECIILLYQLFPRKINHFPYSFGNADGIPYGSTLNLTPNQLKERMKGFDYLLLAYTDDVFWNQYQELFTKPHTDMKPISQYQLCRANGFNATFAKGCKKEIENAYLFKIEKRSGSINLVNLA